MSPVIPVVVAAALMLVTLVVLIALLTRYIVRVPPDAAIVLTGRKAYRDNPETGEREMVGFRFLTAGSAFRIPVYERIDYLPLGEMAIEIDADDLRDVEGWARSISVLVNCRISAEQPFIERAMRRFLTMDLPDIEQIVRTTIESRISNTLLTTDLSEDGSWPAIETSLEAAIRDDLAALGVEIDTLIFRRVPSTGAEGMPANGRGSMRSE